MFDAVDSRVNIPELEQDILEFWRKERIFERSMEERKDGPKYVTYEGPPTVNGSPGVHHVLARAFKDIFPRYKTMQGFYALRKGGWDTHGLPVEIAMEKELGFQDKREIEEYGIAEFNEKCRQSVFRNIVDWEKFTERMAYWTDLDNAYVTCTNDYIEGVWWVLKQLFEKGLLYKDYKVVPYAADSGTPLSSHEVSLGYKMVKDPSVFVRFPLKDQPGVYFLAWTTTPWTLPGNVALAVGENIDYVQVEGPIGDDESETEQLILAAELTEKVLKNHEAYTVVKRFKGKDLLGTHYNPLYTFLPVEQDYAYVVSGDFVSTDDGTGIVHIAPAFGADDMNVGRQYGLPVLMTVNDNGKFLDAVTKFRGLWFKDADPEIIMDLKERGLMYKSMKYEHNYPHSWRTGVPLMYVARETWYIRTTELKQTMIDNNQKINWVPGHIRDGRFGNWLDDLKDWALGRERYWGTPLPIWVDETTGEAMCIGGVEELSQLTGRDLTELDLHRPHVDEITFPNPNGGGTMRRVPEVIDVWFDSGSMPVAQWGTPVKNSEIFEEQFPADYICEAVDQTRGWFYTLHSISSMVFNEPSYKNVICLGLILDENGQKMSKSKGNVVDPWEVMNNHGADAMRWYLYTSGAPGEPRRFSMDLVGEVIRKFYSTLWNTYSFFVTYANIDEWSPNAEAPAVKDRDVLDQWLIAELHQLIKQVTEAYENYDVPGATRPIQQFVDVLSNWYVRLSRPRFWKNDSDADKLAAYATLYEALTTVSKLLAPAMPLLAEELYQKLVTNVDENASDSVHLARWPEYNEAYIDMAQIKQMRLVQKLVSLGRAARESVEIGVRQPLAEAQFLTRANDEADAVSTLSDIITSELNVKRVTVLRDAGDVVSYSLNPLPQLLGKKFGKNFPKVQKTLREGAQSDVTAWANQLNAGENVTVEIDGETFEVTPEEVEVKQGAAEGYAIAEDGGYLAALDTNLTEALIREGLAREVIRRIQITRKDAGLEIEDKINIVYQTSETLSQAIEQFSDYIQSETLAESLSQSDSTEGYHRSEFRKDGDNDNSIKGEDLVLGVQKTK